MGIYVASWYLNTLYLRCFLVCHCEILFIMSQLHFSRFLKNVFLIALEILCLLVRSNYARKYDTILRVGSSFLDYFFVGHLHNVLKKSYSPFVIVTYFYCIKVTLFIFSNDYVSNDVRVMLNYGNCWNLWIVCGSYVIKWSYFSYIFFLTRQLFDNVDIFGNVKITFIVICLH